MTIVPTMILRVRIEALDKNTNNIIDIELINDIDKIIHEPSRLKIIAYLFSLKRTDFSYLKRETGFSWGRLASHLDKLEEAGYIHMEKKLIKLP